MEQAIICFLVLVIFAQQVFFMWMINKVVNKAMSKSYSEYVQAEVYKEQVNKAPPLKDFSFNVDQAAEEVEMLKELNRNLGISL